MALVLRVPGEPLLNEGVRLFPECAHARTQNGMFLKNFPGRVPDGLPFRDALVGGQVFRRDIEPVSLVQDDDSSHGDSQTKTEQNEFSAGREKQRRASQKPGKSRPSARENQDAGQEKSGRQVRVPERRRFQKMAKKDERGQPRVEGRSEVEIGRASCRERV